MLQAARTVNALDPTIVESPSKARLQQLIRMLNVFVAGGGRSRDFVGKMEGEFAECGLDDDDRLSDLKTALAMFGAGDRAADEKMLADECRYALRLIQETPGNSPR